MRSVIVLTAGVLAGCSDPLGSISLEFGAEPLGAEQVTEWSVARLESGRHRVTVRRAADAARSCGDLRADLVRAGGDLTLRVHDTARAGGPGAARACGYTASIDRLPSGRYHLRVLHAGPGRRSDARVVLDHPLHVR